jgi:hypothetical protein
LAHDRDHIGRALIGAVNDFSYRLLARLVNLWVAERNATRLSSCQGLRSALADKRAFFLRQRSEQVQDERINVSGTAPTDWTEYLYKTDETVDADELESEFPFDAIPYILVFDENLKTTNFDYGKSTPPTGAPTPKSWRRAAA